MIYSYILIKLKIFIVLFNFIIINYSFIVFRKKNNSSIMWPRTCLWLFTILLCGIVGGESSEVPALTCPSGCRCFTTAEGLHKASCFSTSDLKKFSQNNKHHNINIMDLSYSNISKINNDLDKFTEVVSLDLSFNSIKVLKNFLQSSKKLVHLNLENNFLKTFSASSVPNSVSSLNLKNNYLENVPSDLYILRDLEHLELKGNPIHCSCENIKIFHMLLNNHVVTDDIKCASPSNRKGIKLSDFKSLEVCSNDNRKNEFVSEPLEDMMFGDEASDTEIFGPISTDKKSMEVNEDIKLVGETWEASKNIKDNEDKEYYPINIETTTASGIESETSFEGSGYIVDQLSPYQVSNFTDDLGSGDHGSGILNNEYELEGSGDIEENITTTTEMFITGPIEPYLFNYDHNDTTTEIVKMPNIYQGSPDWNNENKIESTTNKEIHSSESPDIKKEVVVEGEGSSVKKSDEIVLVDPEATKEPVKTTLGTYICIGIIIVLLIGLIGFSVIKGRIRKNRNRLQIRPQKRDLEKGGKELVDMNKSLLGKPISQQILDDEKERKMNGNYELVPTHETFKKPENGKGLQSAEKETPKPVDENNLKPEKIEPLQNGNRKSNTILPEEQPVISITPTKSEPDGLNSSPNLYPENNFAFPTEYNPVYNHDMGRVKIKLSETPKPKTPVLINRSRSNAGDIIITPAGDQNLPLNNST